MRQAGSDDSDARLDSRPNEKGTHGPGHISGDGVFPEDPNSDDARNAGTRLRDQLLIRVALRLPHASGIQQCYSQEPNCHDATNGNLFFN